MDYSAISTCKILPGIGIARLGNSDTDYYIAPESPGDPIEPKGGFRDLYGRIKRQAARFHIFAYDKDGKVLGELTAKDPKVRICWNVELANMKADWYEFSGVNAGMKADSGHPVVPRRNKNVKDADRHKLRITPGSKKIEGPKQQGQPYQFAGLFFDVSVYLGELRTDEEGRLLVLGGHGKSATVDPKSHVRHYANNDSWYDDTSDGPVNADVSVDDRPITVTGSWVLVTPPKYAASGAPLVTLFDVMCAAAGLDHVPDKPSFTKDVYPIFARISTYQWLNSANLRGHGPFQAGYFSDPDILKRLSDATDTQKELRSRVFKRIRSPHTKDPQEANFTFMPPLSGDEGDATEGKPETWLCLLESQYDVMEKWANGDFVSDWNGIPEPAPSLERMTPDAQVEALNRASLERSIGGAFFPGIEMTYIARNPEIYAEPFRFKQAPALTPGDATKRMAVPWQADFYECNTNWWPAARPDDVVNEETFDAMVEEFRIQQRTSPSFAGALLARIPWARGVGDELRFLDPDTGKEPKNAPPHGPNGMVRQWSELGFVVPRSTPKGETVHLEVGRSRYDGLTDREYFYMMMNLDSFPDLVPKAKELAQAFLDAAGARMDDPTPGAVDDVYRPFPYSPEAFENRLTEIYNILKRDAEKPFDPTTSPFKSKEDLVERIRQLAPFNQTDGAWLRNISQAGPTDEINALLFSIWADEAGDGSTERNHANLYTRLLESAGVELPPLNSRAYAFNPALLDSAFTAPLFQLTISQFTRTFFPEILGMTLQLEWEVLGLWPTIKTFEYFKVDPHFYTMHVGIDNASSGHGAKAKRAVELYLDRVRAETGSEDEVQRQWRRIWNGYVTFEITGHVMEDLLAMLRDRREHPSTPEQRVLDLIVEKRQFGRLNHMDKKLGENYINDWFDHPAGFLEQLKSLVNPGHPESSVLMQKLSFDGPMYKVFTDEEIQVWHNWIVSLAQKPEQQRPIEVQMSMLIDKLRSLGTQEPAHESIQIWGPDPDHAGQEIQHEVSWWFGQTSALFMTALANKKNNLIVVGNPDQSKFYTTYVTGSGSMAATISSTVIDGKKGTDIVRGWIAQGCPIPATAREKRALAMVASGGRRAIERAYRISIVSTDEERARHPRGTIMGMGAVH